MTKKWDIKEWVENWKKLGPELQAQRDNDIRESDTAKAIEALDWNYQYAKRHYPESITSGLVKFYQVLLKGR